jgi:uncharacterized membrane protein (GlpM family)
MELKYVFYFLIGGTVISVVTYFASHARPLLAAFLANMPVITLVTFLTIYHEGGQKIIVPYAKGLVMMMLPWLTYIFTIIFLTPRLGFLLSLTTGFTLYVIFALIILRKY